MDFITPVLNFIQNNIKQPIHTFCILYIIYIIIDWLFKFNITIPYENIIKACVFICLVFYGLQMLIKLAKKIINLYIDEMRIKKDIRLYLLHHHMKHNILKDIVSRKPLEYSNTFSIDEHEKSQLDRTYYILDSKDGKRTEYHDTLYRNCYKINGQSVDYWYFQHNYIVISTLLLKVLKEKIEN